MLKNTAFVGMLAMLLSLAGCAGAGSTTSTTSSSQTNKATSTKASLNSFYLGSVVGYIDNVKTTSDAGASINGWACGYGVASSIPVHLYLNGPAGTGHFVKAVSASMSNEPAVSTACGSTGTNYRFSIPLAFNELAAYQGQTIYVHGISPTGLSNDLLTNSGALLVPSVVPVGTIRGFVDSVTPAPNGGASINGWACGAYVAQSIPVHLYLNGPAGTGFFVKGVAATNPSEQAVADACGASGTNYRYTIPLSYSELRAYGGLSIYVHGISPTNQSNNTVSGSGNFRVPLAPATGTVTGVIDSVTTSATGAVNINGWACGYEVAASIPVHLYVNGPAGTGQFVKGIAAANASEQAVADACGSSGTNYRFTIPLSPVEAAQYAGSTVYVHGISPTGLSNLTIARSGAFTIPGNAPSSSVSALSQAVVASLRWSYAGPIPGMVCTQINEPADPDTWEDNYLCAPQDYGFRWSFAGPIPGMVCTQINEPSDPDAWQDNYLCSPKDYGLRWSYAGALPGTNCVQINEPSDPNTWQDNFLCGSVSPDSSAGGGAN